MDNYLENSPPLIPFKLNLIKLTDGDLITKAGGLYDDQHGKKRPSFDGTRIVFDVVSEVGARTPID